MSGLLFGRYEAVVSLFALCLLLLTKYFAILDPQSPLNSEASFELGSKIVKCSVGYLDPSTQCNELGIYAFEIDADSRAAVCVCDSLHVATLVVCIVQNAFTHNNVCCTSYKSSLEFFASIFCLSLPLPLCELEDAEKSNNDDDHDMQRGEFPDFGASIRHIKVSELLRIGRTKYFEATRFGQVVSLSGSRIVI